jgi:hypothetical protein
MLRKRPNTDLSGDAEELVKRPKLSGSTRSISPDEAILSQPSTRLINDLIGDDCKSQLLGRGEVTDKEPKSSKDARNTESNWATPSRSPVQIINLSGEDRDLDRLSPRTTHSYDLTGKCDKPQREQLLAYDRIGSRDKSRLERIAYDPIEESDKLQPMSIAACDLANESRPQHERVQTNSITHTHDKSVLEKGAVYDLASKRDKLQPESVDDLTNENDKTQHERVLAYDTCFGLICPLIHLIETTHSI